MGNRPSLQSLARLGGASLLCFLLGACWGISHEYSGVIAVNDTSKELLVRHDADVWLLGPGESGRVLLKYASGVDQRPIDYEILDATTCRTLLIQRVDLGPEGVLAFRLTGNLTGAVEVRDSIPDPELPRSDLCTEGASGSATADLDQVTFSVAD